MLSMKFLYQFPLPKINITFFFFFLLGGWGGGGGGWKEGAGATSTSRFDLFFWDCHTTPHRRFELEP